MKINIFVTKEDIKNGLKKSCECCPIARSVKRRLKQGVKIEVGVTRLFLTELLYSAPLSINAREFLLNFDDEKKVKPFRFQLNLPKKVLKNA